MHFPRGRTIGRRQLRAHLFAPLLLILATQAAPALGQDVISIKRAESIIWIKASISVEGADNITLRIKAPTADDSRTWLYQRCTFPYSGPGTYRCGVDRQAAGQHPGSWKAIVSLDDTRHAQRWFEVYD